MLFHSGGNTVILAFVTARAGHESEVFATFTTGSSNLRWQGFGWCKSLVNRIEDWS